MGRGLQNLAQMNGRRFIQTTIALMLSSCGTVENGSEAESTSSITGDGGVIIQPPSTTTPDAGVTAPKLCCVCEYGLDPANPAHEASSMMACDNWLNER